MKTIYKLCLAFFLVLTIYSYTCAQEFEWVKRTNKYDMEEGKRPFTSAIDKDNNIYYIGQYKDSIFIGDTILKKGTTYFCKTNSKGEIQWVKDFHPGTNIPEFFNVGTYQNNVYIVYYMAPVAFVDSAIITFDTLKFDMAKHNGAQLILCYDKDGKLLWHEMLEGLNVYAVFFKDQYIYSANSMWGDLIYKDDTIKAGTYPAKYEILMLKYNINTKKIDKSYIRKSIDIAYANLNLIDVDNNSNICLAFSYKPDTITLSGKQFELKTKPNIVKHNIFSFFDSNFVFDTLIDIMGETDNSYHYNLEIDDMVSDDNNNLYIIGDFVKLYYGDDSIIANYNQEDIFLIKVSRKGKIQWAKSYGGQDDFKGDLGDLIAINDYNYLYIGGRMRVYADLFWPYFDTIEVKRNWNYVGIGYDLYVAKIDTNGHAH